MIVLILLVSFSVLLVNSLIGYIFILILYASLVIIWISYTALVRELIALMILLVYVGAMAVLFIYVRAVSPNRVVTSLFSADIIWLITVFLLFCFLSFLLFSSYFTHALNYNLQVPSEIFTGLGLYLTLVVVLILIFVLAAVTFISPASSTFRSLV